MVVDMKLFERNKNFFNFIVGDARIADFLLISQ